MKDKLITITVDVDGNAVSRNYHDECTPEVWGDRIVDMLNTIQHSEDNKF